MESSLRRLIQYMWFNSERVIHLWFRPRKSPTSTVPVAAALACAEAGYVVTICVRLSSRCGRWCLRNTGLLLGTRSNAAIPIGILSVCPLPMGNLGRSEWSDAVKRQLECLLGHLSPAGLALCTTAVWITAWPQSRRCSQGCCNSPWQMWKSEKLPPNATRNLAKC